MDPVVIVPFRQGPYYLEVLIVRRDDNWQLIEFDPEEMSHEDKISEDMLTYLQDKFDVALEVITLESITATSSTTLTDDISRIVVGITDQASSQVEEPQQPSRMFVHPRKAYGMVNSQAHTKSLQLATKWVKRHFNYTVNLANNLNKLR